MEERASEREGEKETKKGSTYMNTLSVYLCFTRIFYTVPTGMSSLGPVLTLLSPLS